MTHGMWVWGKISFQTGNLCLMMNVQKSLETLQQRIRVQSAESGDRRRGDFVDFDSQDMFFSNTRKYTDKFSGQLVHLQQQYTFVCRTSWLLLGCCLPIKNKIERCCIAYFMVKQQKHFKLNLTPERYPFERYLKNVALGTYYKGQLIIYYAEKTIGTKMIFNHLG